MAEGFGAFLGGVSSSLSALMNYQYAKKLMERQYQYNLRTLRNAPSASREGFVNAGYNPLMALGSGQAGFSASSSGVGADLTSGLAQGVSSAIAMKQNNANIKNTQADTILKNEQADTEKAKRVQMEFQNAMTDVETHLKQKDLSTYDRRFYSNLYEQMQRAENYRANSAVSMMNAETNRMNAHTQKFSAESERINADANKLRADKDRRYADWAKSHPYLSSFDETVQRWRGFNYSSKSKGSSVNFSY